MRARSLALRFVAVAIAGLAACTSSAAGAQLMLDEHATAGDAVAIAHGGDGAMWFTEQHPAAIGRITPAGRLTEYRLGLPANAEPSGLVRGAGRTLWFVDTGTERLGRVTALGTITELTVPLENAEIGGVTTTADGSVWYVAGGGRIVGRVTPRGRIRHWEHDVPKGAARERGGPFSVTTGPDGRVWFVSGRLLGRVVGSRVRWTRIDGVRTALQSIAPGAHGTVWVLGRSHAVQVDRRGRAIDSVGVGGAAQALVGRASVLFTQPRASRLVALRGETLRRLGPGFPRDGGPTALHPVGMARDGSGRLWVTGSRRVAREVAHDACRVPDLAYLSEDAARTAVRRAGCRLAVTAAADDAAGGPVGVVAQGVARRRAIPRGSVVPVTIGHLGTACRWPEGAESVEAPESLTAPVPGGAFAQARWELGEQLTDTITCLCLRSSGAVSPVHGEIDSPDEELDGDGSSLGSLTIAGHMVLEINVYYGDRYTPGSTISLALIDMDTGARAYVGSVGEESSSAGAVIRADGTVAWFEDDKLIVRRVPGEPATVARSNGTVTGLRFDGDDLAWTDDGVERRVAVPS